MIEIGRRHAHYIKTIKKHKTMKKRISLKLFLAVLGRGICQVFQSIGKLFGYKDGSSYGKVIWRIAATCLTTLLALFTICILYAFFREVVMPKMISPEKYYNWESKYISNHVAFQEDCWKDKRRILNTATDEVTLEDIDWVTTSDDNDSLAVFALHYKRGYIDRFTGKVAIPPIYSRAWTFSEGLAAVEKDGKLIFIDHSGETVIDKGLEVDISCPDYIFHNGYCIVQDTTDGKDGLIDRYGNWALHAEYEDIRFAKDYWIVEKGGRQAVFDRNLDTVMPYIAAEYEINCNTITATMPDHTINKYDMKGKLMESNCISEIECLTYDTDEFRYIAKTYYNEYGNISHEEKESTPQRIPGTARCKRYQAEEGWYGLLDPSDGIITPPSYTAIEAIAQDTYYCITFGGCGILLDGKGKRIE